MNCRALFVFLVAAVAGGCVPMYQPAVDADSAEFVLLPNGDVKRGYVTIFAESDDCSGRQSIEPLDPEKIVTRIPTNGNVTLQVSSDGTFLGGFKPSDGGVVEPGSKLPYCHVIFSFEPRAFGRYVLNSPTRASGCAIDLRDELNALVPVRIRTIRRPWSDPGPWCERDT